MDGQLPETYARVEALGGIVSPVESCTLAVTVLRGRPRLSKVLGSAVDDKWVVHLDWINEAWEACVAYRTRLADAGVHGDVETGNDVTDEEEEELEPVSTTEVQRRVYVPPPTIPSREAHAIPNTGHHARRRASQASAEPPVISDLADDTSSEVGRGYASRLPDLEPFPVDIPLSEIPNRAVQRCSPLTCVNQDIVGPLPARAGRRC